MTKSKLFLTLVAGALTFGILAGLFFARPSSQEGEADGVADVGELVALSSPSDTFADGKGAGDAGRAPVVLELFTSQGCSSCPPADALAAKLVSNPALILITRPVTYWDRLGWKDTLGRAENTQLQRDYARNGLAGAGVYTPQIVVNGRDGVVGSDAAGLGALVRAAIDAASGTVSGDVSDVGAGAVTSAGKGAVSDVVEEDGRPILSITRAQNSAVQVKIEGQFLGEAEVVLLALSAQENVTIGRGENGGRRVTYTNVVLDEQKIGDASKGQREFALKAEQLQTKGANVYAILLRRANGGAILAGQYL